MIHVCFGLHDATGRYSKFTGTTMLSMFENSSAPPHSITVHILHDNTFSTENREKFIYLAGLYGQRVEFHNVDELCAEEIITLHRSMPRISIDRHTIATCYRILAPYVLPKEVEKIVYLDADIIVNLDINELWQIVLDDKILGAVQEIANHKTYLNMRKIHSTCRDGLVKEDDYFNAGVLLMNLSAFRDEKEKLFEAFKFIGKNPNHIFLEQDVLNYGFSTFALKLPIKFNQFVVSARSDFTLERKIYHYVSRSLNFDTRDPFNRLWFKYFVQTPWFDEETIGKLYAGFQQIHVGFKQSMVNLSAAMSGKTRAFFAMPNDVDGLKRFFQIRDDEEIITVENQESLKNLLDAMNASHGRKIFFIMLPKFPFQILIQAGFVPGRDFFNGVEFLSEAQGVPLNSWPLIQAM